MSFVNSHEAQLVVNLKELTAENVKMAIGPADIEGGEDGFEKIEGRAYIKDDDYLENIAYIGRLTGSDKPVVIILKNALSAEGFTMSSEDNDEAVIPITFYAYADFEDAQAERVAYEIHWPNEEGDSGGVDG